jgi:CspA family cold shock protein
MDYLQRARFDRIENCRNHRRSTHDSFEYERIRTPVPRLLSRVPCIIKIDAGRLSDPGEQKRGASVVSRPGVHRVKNAVRGEVLSAERSPSLGARRPDGWRPDAARGRGNSMRQNGTVKFFNASKGYGFITPDGGGKDIFVHVTAVEQSGMATLSDGMRISFEIEPDKRGKGPKAVELQGAT